MLNYGYAEKRAHVRMQFDAEIICNRIDADWSFSARCIDLSHSGIAFETTEPITVGDDLDISIDLGSGAFQPLNAAMTVLRIETQNEEKYKVAGIIRLLNV